MANTYVDYTAVASQTDYNFSFEYLRDEHVKVKVNDVIVTNYTIVTSPTPTKIRFDTAPTAGAEIKIYRDSRGDFDPIVDFQDGSVLTQEPLDTAYLHNLYVAQETSEGVGGELLFKKNGVDYDAEGNKIINLGTPGDSTDAANKGYVDQTIDNAIALGGSPAIVSLGGYDVTALGTSITKSLANWTNDLNAPTATGSTTARSLADRFGDVFNVKDFGAVGNGSDDDTDEIQAAITAAYNARTVSEFYDTVTVFIPEGIYIVSNTITVPSYITLKGDGHNSVLKVKDNCTSGFNVLEISEERANNINFNDFAIHGNRSNNTQVITGLSIKPGSDSTGSPVIYSNFNNLYIKECTGYAVEIINGGATRIRFNDCLFRDCVQHNVYSTKLQYSSFNNCVIRTSKTGYSGVVLDGVNNQIIAFNSCQIEENDSYGLYSDRASRISLESCRFISNFGTAIFLQKSDTINITDCQFSSNQGYGALLEGASNDQLLRVHVSNNMFDGNYFNGLYLNYCTAGSITGNIFSGNSQAQSYVSYLGSIYKCIETHTSSPSETPDTSSKWSLSTDVSEADDWVSDTLYFSVNTYSGLFIKQSDHISVLSNTFTGTSQKYGIELGSAVTESYLYDNSIVEFGTDRINPTAQNTDNKIELNKFGQSSVIPASGTWSRGDIVWNEDPQSGEYVGWICTVGGTPGTWKEFGLIQP